MLGEGSVVILPWVGGVVDGVALILISCYSLVVTPSWSIKRGEASGFLCWVDGWGSLGVFSACRGGGGGSHFGGCGFWVIWFPGSIWYV